MNERSFISGSNNHFYIQNYNRELSDKKWQWWGKGVICDYDDDYLNWAAADSWGVSSKLYQNILSSSSVHILSLTLLLWWMICRGLSGTYSLLIGSHTIILVSDWLIQNNTGLWLVRSKSQKLLGAVETVLNLPVTLEKKLSVDGEVGTLFWLVEIRPYWSLIGWHKTLMISDWLTQKINDLWLVREALHWTRPGHWSRGRRASEWKRRNLNQSLQVDQSTGNMYVFSLINFFPTLHQLQCTMIVKLVLLQSIVACKNLFWGNGKMSQSFKIC